MANLVIDIGNTLIKVALFEGSELMFIDRYSIIDNQTLDSFLTGYTIDTAIISTVKNQPGDWETTLSVKTKLVYFNAAMATGINNHYKTPHTLGLDRLAAIIGANQLFPQQNTLVIDGGTCITYDYIDAGANYFGGSISPGLNMRYKALNHYTAVLPVVNPDGNFDSDAGNDTVTAIVSGVQNGIKHELNGFIEAYAKRSPALNIVLTGGDGIFFDTLLKNSIFAPYIKNEPHLVLKGLNAATQKHND